MSSKLSEILGLSDLYHVDIERVTHGFAEDATAIAGTRLPDAARFLRFEAAARARITSGVDDRVLPLAERLFVRKERQDVAYGMRYVLAGLERGLPSDYFREAAAKMERAAENVFEDDLPGACDDGPSLAGLGDLTDSFEFAWESACAQTELAGLA